MRALFSVVGLLAVLLVVSLLAKKQLGTPHTLPTPPAATASTASAPPTPQALQQQMQKSLDSALQPRAIPPDSPE